MRMKKTLCQECKDKNNILYEKCKANECTCLALRLKGLGHTKGIKKYIGKELFSLYDFLDETVNSMSRR